MVVPIPVRDLARRRRDRTSQLAGHQPQLGVRLRRRLLQPPQRLDEPPRESPSADWKIFSGPLSLRTVKGVGGNPHLAQ